MMIVHGLYTIVWGFMPSCHRAMTNEDYDSLGQSNSRGSQSVMMNQTRVACINELYIIILYYAILFYIKLYYTILYSYWHNDE